MNNVMKYYNGLPSIYTVGHEKKRQLKRRTGMSGIIGTLCIQTKLQMSYRCCIKIGKPTNN